MELKFTAKLATPDEILAEIQRMNTQSTESSKKLKINKVCEICGLITTKYKCTWCHKLYVNKDTLRKHSKKIHQFTNMEFETIEVKKSETKQDLEPQKTNYTTSTPKFRVRPGIKKWLKKPQPKRTTDENPI